MKWPQLPCAALVTTRGPRGDPQFDMPDGNILPDVSHVTTLLLISNTVARIVGVGAHEQENLTASVFCLHSLPV